MSRRLANSVRVAFGAGLVIAIVFGAIVALAPPWSARPDPIEPGAPGPVRDIRAAETKAFLDRLRTDAAAKGLPVDVVERAIKGFTADEAIADLNASQPEHVKTAGEYVALLVSDTRLSTGRAKLVDHAALLARIEQAYGVDRHVIVAIWGIESGFGQSMGERSVIRSLTTLAVTDQRRAAFWQGELLAALAIVQRGDNTLEGMTGSWAGAMGHTQFMPTTYLQHAVDFDADGRRDIWSSPADALASTANYLKVSGWQSGQPPMIEVVVPAGFAFAHAAPAVVKAGAAWEALGIKPASGGARLAALDQSALILPAGHTGPAFLTGQNFRAILKYNRSMPYALAVSHLAERLAGAGPLAQAWPVGDRGLSRVEREELQTRLAARGHEIGAVDGIIGTATRAAIRAFQHAEGLPADGHPDAALLSHLRRGTGRAQP